MNYPLFETICIKNNQLQNIEWHQMRYEQSLLQFYGNTGGQIFSLFDEIEKFLQNHPPLSSPITRCRVSYNQRELDIQFFPYQAKTYRRFQIVYCDEIDYSLKYQDREKLNELLAQKGDCDEIIIIKQGKVTDCSIGNLIFKQGNHWFTPDSPLLNGTQRQYLLHHNKIEERCIFAEDLPKFSEIRLINALNPFQIGDE